MRVGACGVDAALQRLTEGACVPAALSLAWRSCRGRRLGRSYRYIPHVQAAVPAERGCEWLAVHLALRALQATHVSEASVNV